jgi:hypothetical protein
MNRNAGQQRAENSMNDAETSQPGPAGENDRGEPIGDPENSRTDAGSMDPSGNSAGSDELDEEIARFSRLSAEMKDCLSGIIRKTKDAVVALEEIQNSVEQKKGELKEVHAIEACAASLKALEEEYRIQKEEFAASMQDRRRQWTEEENLRRKEEEAYMEDLQRRRQQQQQEFERKMVEERSLLRNKMEDELREILQEARDRQRVFEEELQKRERALGNREQECGRLIQELESLMKRLAERRTRDVRGPISPVAPSPAAKACSGDWRSGRDASPGTREPVGRDEGASVISVRRMLLQKNQPGASRIAGEETRDSCTLENNS